MRRPIFLALVAAVLLLIGYVLLVRFYGDNPEVFVLSGTIEVRQIEVGSRLGGRVARVLAQEGSLVKAGQPLVHFETYDLEAKHRQAEAAVQQAQVTLQKLRRGFRPEEIAQARAAAEAAKAQLELLRKGPRSEEIDRAQAELDAATAEARNARTHFERISHLFESGVLSRQNVDDARTRLELAQARQKSHREQLDLLLAGTRPEEIEAAEKRYAEATARLRLYEKGTRQEDIAAAAAVHEQALASLQAIEAQLAETEVKAPSDARIEVLDIRPGDLISPGLPIAILLEPDQIYVKVYVPESKLGLVRPGEEVEVTVDSFPERRFRGTIAFVAQQGEFTPRNVQTRDEREHQVFAVRVQVENGEGLLRPGMAADVYVGKCRGLAGGH